MPLKDIYYSDKYFDEKFEYRHVMLPKDTAKLVPKNHLMSESEWRSLGVQQSPGWIHYMTHGNWELSTLFITNLCTYIDLCNLLPQNCLHSITNHDILFTELCLGHALLPYKVSYITSSYFSLSVTQTWCISVYLAGERFDNALPLPCQFFKIQTSVTFIKPSDSYPFRLVSIPTDTGPTRVIPTNITQP